jgi:hypothetical protein
MKPNQLTSKFIRTAMVAPPLPLCVLCASAVSLIAASAAEPVLRVIKASATASNLVQNGDFEHVQNGLPANWSRYEGGFELVSKAGRNGSSGIVCQNDQMTGGRGASQVITLNQREPAPIIVKGWSKAENVSGSADNNYSIYVDLVYADDTPLWGQTANFRCGTHDWEAREVIITPEKPIKRLSVYGLFRGHSGRAWFDDVFLEEIKAGQGSYLWQGIAVVAGISPTGRGPTKAYRTGDRLDLNIRGDRVETLRMDDVALEPQPRPGPSGFQLNTGTGPGFMARDAASGSDVYLFDDRLCLPLKLQVAANITSNNHCLTVEGRVVDVSSRDRAVTLAFALPVEAQGWRWWDDIRRSRVISGKGEYANTVGARCGATGTMSLYPLAAISNDRFGLAMAMDMAKPAVCRLVYHAGLKQLFIAYDFGLVAETKNFPFSAEFRFVIYRFDAAGGFRAAFDKYTKIFPDYFQVRAKDQGIWMPFTDVSTVQGWQDFGFKYHEGNNNVKFDDENNILSFRYTEPMTWWMPMAKELPRTPETALKVRDELLASGKPGQKTPAQITKVAAMYDDAGQPALMFRNEPWCNGAVWSLNPNPHLSGDINFAQWHWSDDTKKKLYGPDAKGQLDGEYLDSLEGYVTTDLNFRREHFASTTVPLTFSQDTKRPCLYKGLAVFEFTKWFCDDVHRLNKLTFANGVPYRFTFLCPWLDVMGTETDWNPGGQWRPPSAATLSLWRTMSGAKPYILLMNTRYDAFTPDLVEKYFQRCAFYGFYPSMFSHNAAENPYWQNPKWYNRDRPLFKKYIPIIKQVAESGWQPVTLATATNANVWLERFGQPGTDKFYLTAFNSTAQPQRTTIALSPDAIAGKSVASVTELLENRVVPVINHQWQRELKPEQAAVFEIRVK